MEIKANELRIWNCVNYFTEHSAIEQGGTWITTKLDINDLVLIESGISQNYALTPLTEEILLKCGFVKTDDETFNKNGIELFFWNFADTRLDGFYYQTRAENSDIKIKHLHQLQNLYFALTGTELDITL